MASEMTLPLVHSRSQLRRLNPVLRAYVLAWLSVTTPTLLRLLLATLKGKVALKDALGAFEKTLRRQARSDKFPAVCAYLIAGATVLPAPFLALLDHLRRRHAWQSYTRIQLLERLALSTTFLSTILASWLTFNHLNRHDVHEIEFKSEVQAENALRHDTPPPKPRLAGRTLDLTFFGVVRALDIGVGSLWSYWKSSKPKQDYRSVETSTISALFAVSSCFIMWAWFYDPHRLPRSYNSWISSAAQVDHRLIEALRECRRGNFRYGEDTGLGDLLGHMSTELGYPYSWGDPAQSIPIPCELVHGGMEGCERHAASRFIRGWKFAMGLYLPLNLVILLHRKPSQESLLKAVAEACRSSAFLGAFLALFYYGVCLARTRLGPTLVGNATLGSNDYDGGIGTATGCAMCGWSILVEKPERRREIAFFVAPRALATLFPRRYDRQQVGYERMVFSLSAAVILTAAQRDQRVVRGVLGRILNSILG